MFDRVAETTAAESQSDQTEMDTGCNDLISVKRPTTAPEDDKMTRDAESELWSDLIASKLAIKSKKRTKAKSMQAIDQHF